MTTQKEVYEYLGHIRKDFIGPDTCSGRTIYTDMTNKIFYSKFLGVDTTSITKYYGGNPWFPFGKAGFKPTDNEKRLVDKWLESHDMPGWYASGTSKNIKKCYSMGDSQASLKVKDGLYLYRPVNTDKVIPVLRVPSAKDLMDRKKPKVWNNWNRCKWVLQKGEFDKVIVMRGEWCPWKWKVISGNMIIPNVECAYVVKANGHYDVIDIKEKTA